MAKYIVQHRRGTESQLNASEIKPLAGEIVVEIDEINNLHKLKIGDGEHTYSELAYLKAGDEIITQVLAQALPRTITVTLDVEQWTEIICETDPNLGYYGQTITVDGVTQYSRLDLQPDADMLAEFRELDLVFVTENKDGKITVYSVGDMPLKSYTMQATIIETEVIIDSEKIIGTPVGTPTLKADWDQQDETKADYIKNKPAIVADEGAGSIIEGDLVDNRAKGKYSHAEGRSSTAEGDYSHTEGHYTNAIGNYSRAGGTHADANGTTSFAFGSNVIADNVNTIAFGYNTVANNKYEFVSGKFNDTTNTDTIFVLGNGAKSSGNSNAIEVTLDGNMYVQDKIYVGGTGANRSNAKEVAIQEYVSTQIEAIETAIDNHSERINELSNEIITTDTYDFRSTYHEEALLRWGYPSDTQINDKFIFAIPMGWKVEAQLFLSDGNSYAQTIGSAIDKDGEYELIHSEEYASWWVDVSLISGEAFDAEDCPVTITRERSRLGAIEQDIDAIEQDIGDIDTALDAIIALQNAYVGGEA